MLSFKSIVLIAAALASTKASGLVGLAPAVAAPLVTPTHVGYAHAVPQNVPPYAAQINVETRAINVPAPYAAAAPYFAAPSLYSAPYASPYTLPGPLAAPIAAPYAAPYPYAAAPLVRSAYQLAPTFVR